MDCQICYNPAPPHKRICPACIQLLHKQLSPTPFHHTLMTTDQRKQLTTVLSYRPPLSHWIKQIKFHRQLHWLPVLSELVEHCYRPSTSPDYLIPMPCSTIRLAKRGVNLALELAKQLSRQLNIPILNQTLKRHHRRPQSACNSYQRQHNLIGSFWLHTSPPPEASIMLVDDVITTGASLQCAHHALQHHVAAVSYWCLCQAG